MEYGKKTTYLVFEVLPECITLPFLIIDDPSAYYTPPYSLVCKNCKRV
jgi:hypothetical protein